MDSTQSGAKRSWSTLQGEQAQLDESKEQGYNGAAKRPCSQSPSLRSAQPTYSHHQPSFEGRHYEKPPLSTLPQSVAEDWLPPTDHIQSGHYLQDVTQPVAMPQIVVADHDLWNKRTDIGLPEVQDVHRLETDFWHPSLSPGISFSEYSEREEDDTDTESPRPEEGNGPLPSFDTCFGMVQLNVPTLRLDVLGNTSDTRIDVLLQISGSVVIVRNHENNSYAGIITGDTIQAILKLAESLCITLVGYLILSRKAKKQCPDYTFCIAIQGKRQDMDQVGAMLGEAGIFIQPPEGFQPTVPYLNPQTLRRPGTEKFTGSFHGFQEPSEPSSTVFADSDPRKYQVLQVFDTAQGPSVYESVCPSTRLRTSLKEHQVKALTMMIEKESGRLENTQFPAMWNAIISSNGSVRYKNTVVSVFQRDTPSLCLGGLLADDMGLGKTLSMLALITAYLDHVEKAIITEDDPNPRNTTLIVTPMSLLLTWKEQINRHIHLDRISYHVYHGAGKQKPVHELKSYDIVLTTYDTLVVESRRQKGNLGQEAEGVFSLEWGRIVLDEAHVIRNASSKRHQIMRRLKAKHRWCLTGSPMFNRVEDFGSLLSFLRAAPFHEPSFFNSHVSNPLKRDTQKPLETLRRLVQAVSLRRTKDSVLGELHLPLRELQNNEVTLDVEEQHLYDVLRKSYGMILEFPETTDAESQSTPCIFQTILRLRQFCNHGLDLLPLSALAIFEDHIDSRLVAAELRKASQTCAGCAKTIKRSSRETDADPLLDCGHQLCSRCDKKRQEGAASAAMTCGLCSATRTPSNLSPIPRVSDAMDLDNTYKPSSKVKALLHNLHIERSHPTSPPIKSVIFSCWTKMLDQIGKALRGASFRYERIDGSKTEKKRWEALHRFRNEPDCCILLASIGSAGVGLDLTVASRVHLMEPQWSPMAEEQALDRVHRMGQTRPVVATRYIVKNSIEEYVVSVQETKSRIIKRSFENDAEAEKLNAKERLMKYFQ